MTANNKAVKSIYGTRSRSGTPALLLPADFGVSRRGKAIGSNTPASGNERYRQMGKLGKEVKRAVNKVAKGKGSGGGTKVTKGFVSLGKGADKAKRAARELLK